MKDVFLFQRSLPHYRVPVFAALDRALDGRLLVCSGPPPVDSALINAGVTPFATVTLRNTWIGGERAIWQPFLEPFRRHGRPSVVIAEASPRILSLYPLVTYCRAMRIPVILWGHVGSRRRTRAASRHPKDWLHRVLAHSCDAFICYSESEQIKLAKAIDVGKIFVARNTLDTERLFQLRRELESLGRAEVKRQLNLKSRRYICFLGRLRPDKDAVQFLDVLRLLQAKGEEVGAVVIGGGPMRAKIESYISECSLSDVRLLGSLASFEESAPYLWTSDTLLVPGAVGLAVNHALCLGVPVVTLRGGRKDPAHGPEIDFVRPGETGQLVSEGIEELAEAVMSVVQERQVYYDGCVRFAEAELRLDRMIQGFIEALASMPEAT